MSNEVDLSGAVDMLKEMLSGDEGKQQIQNIIGMFGGGDNSTAQAPAQQVGGFDNIDMMFKLQKVMSVMNSGESAKQAAFLQSLKELLRPERRSTVDNAVKFLGVGRAIKAFKELEGV